MKARLRTGVWRWMIHNTAHIGVDPASKVIHTVVATASSVADCTNLPDLLHGDETRVWGGRAYRGQWMAILEIAPAAHDFTKRRCFLRPRIGSVITLRKGGVGDDRHKERGWLGARI